MLWKNHWNRVKGIETGKEESIKKPSCSFQEGKQDLIKSGTFEQRFREVEKLAWDGSARMSIEAEEQP